LKKIFVIKRRKGETAMRLYIGVDFHPYQQTVCWMDVETGELHSKVLRELDEMTEFYGNMPPSVVGIEASSRAIWFEDLIFECGHELVVGNPVEIRKRALSRHKSDKRDAENIYTLLLRGEFPTLWQRPRESSDILDIISLRWSLVRQRTQVSNRLQRIARECGFRRGTIRTLRYQAMIKEASLGDVQRMRREHLFRQFDALNSQIDKLDRWLEAKGKENEQVQLLMTQQGVGYLTALSMVHTVGDIRRFETTRKVTAYVGLDPLDDSSADRVRKRKISKAGSRQLRHLLGQSANIAARYDKRLQSFYKRLSRKKPKGVAKAATSRKLAVKLSIMLRDQITAEEFDARGQRTVDDARKSPGPEMVVA
jgi:transposase